MSVATGGGRSVSMSSIMSSCDWRLPPPPRRYHHGGRDRGLQEDGRQPGQRSHAHRRQFRRPHHAGHPGLDQPGPLQVPRWVHSSTFTFTPQHFSVWVLCDQLMVWNMMLRASWRVSSCSRTVKNKMKFNNSFIVS